MKYLKILIFRIFSFICFTRFYLKFHNFKLRNPKTEKSTTNSSYKNFSHKQTNAQHNIS